MAKYFKKNPHLPATSRCPTELLDSAIRWETARSAVFHNWGMLQESWECNALRNAYQKRAMHET